MPNEAERSLTTYIRGHYFYLKLGWYSLRQVIIYHWADYGPDLKFTQIIVTQTESDQLSSLRKYLKTNPNIHYDGTLSMPFYLGLTTKENVEWLHDYISETYSNLFEEAQELYKAKLSCDKLLKVAK